METMSKALIFLGLFCGLLGLNFVYIFPDPYHRDGLVNIYTWIVREIDELINGEKVIA